MIKSQSKDISVSVDPISFLSGIKVLAGNPVQTYNNDTHEFEPDRSLVPCLLMPYVSVSDPEGMMNGEQEIISCSWYEGVPKADYSNRVSADTEGYAVGKEGNPAYSLSVEKNFENDKPVDIHAVFVIMDNRTGKTVTFEGAVTFSTNLYESNRFALKTDCEGAWEIDVTKETEDAQGRWMHTISAQLYKGGKPVDDANAAYWWQVSDDGDTFRDVSDDELNLFITGKENGVWSRTIGFDARMMRKLTFRVKAAYYEGERPDSPTMKNLVKTVTVKTVMPPTMDFLIQQESGMKVNAAMDNDVRFTCTPRTNRGALTKTSLFKVEWYARSKKSGVSEKHLGSGFDVTFKPSSLGFDINYPMSVYAKIYTYAVHAVITDGTSALTSGGAYLITKKYE